MRRIVTAITAVSLAFSLVAMATPANAAVAGYDSAYAGESAFLNLAPGQSGPFTVFFANTGSTSWVRNSSSQVDLAACLEDKVTCNQQDATEAPFNSGWLSTTRYTTHTQTVVAPGQVGTFTYNVQVPASQAAGTYRFNGALVLSSTGADIRNEGYYQDVTVGGGAGAASITSIAPASGPVGTDVIIAGSGFVCTPTFPTVTFGTASATVLSCGATSVTADAPQNALGASSVTVTNTGAAASNAVTFTYTDTTKPTFNSLAVSGDVATVTFSEPVCGTYVETDWLIQNVAAPGDLAGAGSTSNLPADCTKAVTSFEIILTGVVPNGAFTEATLVSGANTTDASLNTANAPQSRQATAVAPESTRPTLVSASGAVGSTSVTLTFSEPVHCDAGQPAITDFTIDRQGSTSDPTVTAVGSTNACGGSRTTADTSFNITLSSPLVADTAYTVTLNAGAAGDIQDVVGNTLTVPASISFTSGAGDTTPPIMTDARVLNNAGPSSDFVEAGDSFTVTFNEAMVVATSATISIQDQDGTQATMTCGAAAGVANGATCTLNTAGTTLTVVLQGTLAGSLGTTAGLSIPFNITAYTGVTDAQSNPPNVLGSTDRLVDYE